MTSVRRICAQRAWALTSLGPSNRPRHDFRGLTEACGGSERAQRAPGWWGGSRAGRANSSVIKFRFSAHLLFAHGALSPGGGSPLTTRTIWPAETTRIRRVFDLSNAEARRRQKNSGARPGLDEPPTGHAAGELIGLKIDVSGEFTTAFELVFVQEP